MDAELGVSFGGPATGLAVPEQCPQRGDAGHTEWLLMLTASSSSRAYVRARGTAALGSYRDATAGGNRSDSYGFGCDTGARDH